MKALNTMEFVSNAVEGLVRIKDRIETTDTYEAAQAHFNRMMGYIDALNTFNNTMICLENNDFTGDFGGVLYHWTRRGYQALVDKAVATKQSNETVEHLLRLRDEFKEG